jgi:hypothetical protein
LKISTINTNKSVEERVFEILNSLPNDEVISTKELEQKAGTQNVQRSMASFVKNCSEPVLIGNKHTRVWGNDRAIAALRKQLNSKSL